MKVLEVSGLTKRFSTKKGREIRALDSVSFSIEKGQTLGLVGGSGSGKTTLALCLLRLSAPSSGGIQFMKQDWLALKGTQLRIARRKMQPIFQDPESSLNPRFRISQVIGEPLASHRMGNKSERFDRVRWLARKVGLEEAELERVPSELSGGQRQRAAIARALAPEPELLVADEPVSSLDATTRRRILRLFAELKADLGLTMLFISHNLAVVEGVCDAVAVIWRGRLVEVAETKEVFQNPLHRYTRALLEAAAGNESKITPGQYGDESAKLREIDAGHWAAI